MTQVNADMAADLSGRVNPVDVKPVEAEAAVVRGRGVETRDTVNISREAREMAGGTDAPKPAERTELSQNVQSVQTATSLVNSIRSQNSLRFVLATGTFLAGTQDTTVNLYA